MPTPTPRPLPTLWPTGTPEPHTYSALHHYFRGHTLYKEGNLQQAIDQFSLAIAANLALYGSSFNALEWRAALYNKLGYYELAIKYLDRLVRQGPKIVRYYIRRGSVYLSLDQYQRAIQDYDKAIQLKPDVALYYAKRAKSHRSLGQYTEADADKAKACSLDSKYC